MRWNDGKSRHFFVKLAEPADDLVCKRHVTVAVAQDERLADALFETAFVINGVADVKQSPRWSKVYEDAHASRRMAATVRRPPRRPCKDRRSRQKFRTAPVR